MSRKFEFNENALRVRLDIPVENGWKAEEAVCEKGGLGFLAGVVFSKSGEDDRMARLDLDKNWFIDEIPMRGYAKREAEVRALAGSVKEKIDSDTNVSAARAVALKN